MKNRQRPSKVLGEMADTILRTRDQKGGGMTSEAERKELTVELDFLRKQELVRLVARRQKVKTATLRHKMKDELIQDLIDCGPPYA